jgi:hypothetical protein
VRVTGYAYPWDVVPGFAERALAAGADRIALAVAYHAVRAATPWRTDTAAVDAPAAALYRPVRESVWGGRELRPQPGPFDAAEAAEVLRDNGIPVSAWLVLTHATAVGSRVPRVSVVDCFGSRYPWALCPAQPDVLDYAADLAAEALRELPADEVVLEACGQLGAVHQHLHEKTDAVWSPAAVRLLSVCCCPACAAGWAGAGLDPELVRGLLADRVRALVAGGDLTATDPGLPAEVAAVLLAVRQRAADRLRGRVRAVLGGRPVRLHADPDPWATGALPGLTPDAAAELSTPDGVVLPAWQPGPAAVERVRTARALLPDAAVGAYVTVVAPAPPAEIARYVGALAGAGADELHLYHFGLAGPARLPYVDLASRAAHAGGTPG